MADIKILEKEFKGIPKGKIVLLEMPSENVLGISINTIKILTDMGYNCIVLSANLPYPNLISLFKENSIDIGKVFILDCVCKNLDLDVKKADNVVFINSITDLTNISICISECADRIKGNKIILIDTIATMLIHNNPNTFAIFLHTLLTKMRLKGISGILFSLEDEPNKEVRTEIAQLCDRVIKVSEEHISAAEENAQETTGKYEKFKKPLQKIQKPIRKITDVAGKIEKGKERLGKRKKGLKKEVEIELKKTKPRNVEGIYQVLGGISEAIGNGDISKARELYLKARELYTKLPKQKKQSIYDEILGLYKQLNQAITYRNSAIKRGFIKTHISGFDELIKDGIPKGSSVLVAGGPGSGKTIFCLQTMANAAANGEKCLYLSFEESEEKLKQHMEDFGWDWKALEKNNNLRIVRKDPFLLTGSIEAMLERAKGELLIDLNEFLDIIPQDFKPDRIIFDSISAVNAAFSLQQESYRIFIEQLFRYLEQLGATTLLISETEQAPVKYSKSGEEEFLADGIILVYDIKRGDSRASAIEVVKMRGVEISKKIVPFKIESGKGIIVYPKETVFSEV